MPQTKLKAISEELLKKQVKNDKQTDSVYISKKNELRFFDKLCEAFFGTSYKNIERRAEHKARKSRSRTRKNRVKQERIQAESERIRVEEKKECLLRILPKYQTKRKFVLIDLLIVYKK